MRELSFNPLFKKKLQKIQKTDRKLFNKVKKQLSLFQENPKHVSLKLHKLKGDLKNMWSIAIDRNYRMLFVDDEMGIYFVDLGTHDEVYKK
jgi:addiction module RelE/StbE family toxin